MVIIPESLQTSLKLKFDDLTEAEADLIKIVGRMPIAIGITEPERFVKVNKGN